VCDRINENTTDNEQDHPYQIIDVLLELEKAYEAFCDRPTKSSRSRRIVGTAAAMMTMSLYIVHARLFGRNASKLPLGCKLHPPGYGKCPVSH
jgi:hypothetical protein